jgi:PHD/YefM family antitoxin component YafN of YafNO toxin-antitoxin module
MTTTIAITKARTNLGALVQKVRLEKGYIILEKDGLPAVGIMDIDEFEDYLDARNADMAKEMAQSKCDVSEKRTRPARTLLDL